MKHTIGALAAVLLLLGGITPALAQPPAVSAAVPAGQEQASSAPTASGSTASDPTASDPTASDPTVSDPKDEAPVLPVDTKTILSVAPGSGRSSSEMKNKARPYLYFSTATSQPVCAAKGGTVIFADWKASLGQCLQILQDDGLIASYAHLAFYKGKDAYYPNDAAQQRQIGFRVTPGQTVKTGEVIGDTGDTGNASGLQCRFWLTRETFDKDGHSTQTNLNDQDAMKYLGISALSD